MKHEIKLLSEHAKIPTKGSQLSACWDLYSPADVCCIPGGRETIIPTDLAISWDDPTYYLQILSRSGLCAKHNLVTQAGVIDIDYRQNISVILQNHNGVSYDIHKGDRIAQYTFIKIDNFSEIQVVEEFQELVSNRTGGFGSSGK